MRRTIAVMALTALLACTAAAGAAVEGVKKAGHHRHRIAAPILSKIHRARDMTWHWQALMGRALTPYRHSAERHTDPAFRRWVLHEWKHRRRAAHRAYQRYGLVPAAFRSDMACISEHEEYGMDGPNTVAGYFGLVYPPSGYIDPGPSIAAAYGDSWLQVPLEQQLRLAYSLYRAYGWDPWTTAPGCGLA